MVLGFLWVQDNWGSVGCFFYLNVEDHPQFPQSTIFVFKVQHLIPLHFKVSVISSACFLNDAI